MIDRLEKRKFQRLEFPIDVMVEIASTQNVLKELPHMRIKSRNISKEGICLETKSTEVNGVNLLSGLPFSRDNFLRLNIEIIPGDPPLVAIGEVRWYDIAHDIPEFVYRLGVAFTEIKSDEKDRLARFLKSIHKP